MRIAVDLDGVVFDLVSEVLTRWNREFQASYKYDSIIHYELWRNFTTSESFFDGWWWDQCIQGLFADLLPYPTVYEFLEELKLMGHEIVIITSRQLPWVEDTAYSLNSLEIPHDELHFCGKKWKVDCDIYIDDNPNLLRRFGKLGKPLLIPTRPWTQGVQGTSDDYYVMLKYIEEKSYGY